jgi:hypothetical protein
MNFIANYQRVKSILYALEGFGFITAVVLAGLTFGLGIKWHRSPEELATSFGYITNDQFYIFAFKFCEFSFLLLILMLCLRIDKFLLKILGLGLLAWMIFQSWILFEQDMRGGLPKVVKDYSEFLGLLEYTGHFFLALASALLLLHLGLICLSYYVDKKQYSEIKIGSDRPKWNKLFS